MTIRNQVQSNFPQIVSNNANGNITGVNFTDLSNVALPIISNIHIPGGTNRQVLSTDGNGNLNWQNTGIIATNVAWVDSGFVPSTTYPPQAAGFNFVFVGTGNLAALAPSGSGVRFRQNGPTYTVSFVIRLSSNSFRMTFTTSTTETINATDQLLIVGDGIATNILAGNGIVFTPNANTSSLTISTTSISNAILNGLSNVRIPATSSNIIFSVNGTNNVAQLSTTSLAITRGASSTTNIADEYIRLGGNSTASTVLMTLNTAPSNFSGIRLSKSGTQRWFLGSDNTSANGNFILQNPNTFYGGSLFRITESGINYRIPPHVLYSSTAAQPVSSGSQFDPLVAFSPVGTTKYSSTVTESQFGISYNSTTKIWTFNTAGVYLMVFTVTFEGNSSGLRTAWLGDNSATILSRMTVPGVTSPFVNGITVTAQAYMAVGSQLTINVNQNSGQTLNIGGSLANPTTLSITRL